MFLHIFFAVFPDKMISFSLANIINYTKSIKDGSSVEYHLLTSYKNATDRCTIFGVKFYDMNNKQIWIDRVFNYDARTWCCSQMELKTSFWKLFHCLKFVGILISIVYFNEKKYIHWQFGNRFFYSSIHISWTLSGTITWFFPLFWTELFLFLK